MKLCTKCVLPETFPGIKFDEQGVCQYCRTVKSVDTLSEDKERYRKKFEDFLAENTGKSEYDALVGYSGGKDSSYVLYLLKKVYGLKVLAVTLDNGFLPDRTMKNIALLTDTLSVDHVFIRPPFELLKKIFQGSYKKNIFSAKTLTRAAPMCTACIAFSKFGTLRIAIDKGIPMVAYGWSPGQIPLASSFHKNKASMLRTTNKVLQEPLQDLAGHEIDPYFLEQRHLENDNALPYNVSPLAFLEYDETKIRAILAQFGWKAPQEVDANTTNCLLNALAITRHEELYRFHPYAFELAKLVREGAMGREEALEKLNEAPSPAVVELVKEKLGL